MQQPFGFLLGGSSPFRTLLNTIRPDVPKPIQATGFINQPAAATTSGRILDASVPTYPTAFADVRASSATYYNSSGLVTTAASNTQRIDYNPTTLALAGLLVEPAGTNIATQSGDLWNGTPGSNWTRLESGASNIATAPDGTTSAAQVTSNGGGSAYSYQLNTVTSGLDYTFSVYVKKDVGTDWLVIFLYDTTHGDVNCWFNVTTGAFGTIQTGAIANTVQNVGNGWWRISVTVHTGGTSTDYGVITVDADNSRACVAGHSQLYWGAQAEQGSAPSSYIATTTASATRAADAYSFTLNAAATQLTFTFDDLSTQIVSGLTGGSTYNIPTNLNRPWILYIDDNAGGATTADGVGVATGTSTVAAVGASLYAGVGSAAGTSIVSGVGASLAAATGAAAGTSTVTATGKALFNGVGSAAGTSTVTATGAALANSVGSSAGTSTVLATGRSTAASVGASAGVSTVSGVGAALAASVGSAAGTSTDAATGSSLAKGVGNAAGTSTVLGVSGTVAVAAGTSTVTGVGATLFNAIGTAAGTSTATATGVGAVFAVGVSSGISTVSGIGKSLAVAVGSAAGVGTAAGLSPSLIMQAVGLATGSSIVVGVGNAHRPGTWQIAVRGTMDIPTPWKIGNTAIDTIPTVPGAQSIYSDSTPDIYQVGDIYSQTAQNTWKVATRGNMDVQTVWKIAR